MMMALLLPLLVLMASFHVTTVAGWDGLDPCLDPINCTGIQLNINVSDPENCSQYFLCVGAALYPQQCPRGLQFDRNFAICLDERTALLIHCSEPCLNGDPYKPFIVYPSSKQHTTTVVRHETETSDTSSTASVRDTRDVSTATSASEEIASSQATFGISPDEREEASTTVSNPTPSSLRTTNLPSSSVTRTLLATESGVEMSTSGGTTTGSRLALESTLHSTPLSSFGSTPELSVSTLKETSPTKAQETSTTTTTTTATTTTTNAHLLSSLERSASNETTVVVASLSTTDATTVVTSLSDIKETSSGKTSLLAFVSHDATTTLKSSTRQTTKTSQPTVFDNYSKSPNYSATSSLGLSTNSRTTTVSSYTSGGGVAGTSQLEFSSHRISSETETSDMHEPRGTTELKPVSEHFLTEETVATTALDETDYVSEDITTTSTMWTDSVTTISSEDLWRLCNREIPCTRGDRFGDAVDCTKFFECVAFLGSGNYLMSMSCPASQLYDPLRKSCTRHVGEDICFDSICKMSASHTVSVSPNPVLSGRPMNVRCSFRVLFVVQPIQVSQFTWRLNGFPLSSTQSDQRIQSGPMVWDDRGFWNSTLTFNPVTSRDSGTIDCIVKYGNQETSVNSTGYIDVLPTPTVEIRPMNAVVVRNESIALVCSAAIEEYVAPSHRNTTVKVTPKFSFSWFRSNQPIDIHNDTDCFASANTANVSVITCKPMSDADYFCRVNFTFGDSDSSSISITVVDERSLLCKQDNKDGIVWSPVMVNTTGIASCGPTSTGFRTRRCSSDGGSAVWDEPNADDCVDKTLVQLLSEVKDVRQGISINSSNTTKGIAEGLRNYLSDAGSELNFGNFNASLEILKELGYIQSYAGNITTPGIDEVKAVLWSTSSLLNSTNDPLWKILLAHNTLCALPVMDVVNVYGQKLAKTLKPGADDTISYEYLEVSAVCNYASKFRNFSFPASNGSSGQEWTNSTKDRIYFQNPVDLQDDDEEAIYYISGSIYRNLNEYVPDTTDISNLSRAVLGSRIVSLTVDGLRNRNNLSIPVEIVLEDVQTPNDYTDRSCVFWNADSKPSGSWSAYGCLRSVSNSDPKTTICECSHLTNFAVLFSLSPAKGVHRVILTQISTIGCIVSIISLFLLLVLFGVRWKRVHSHHAVVVINLCIALIAANIVFLAGVNKTAEHVACTVVAVLLHYFFLAAFCVMLIEGIQLLLYVALPFYIHRRRDTAILLITAWTIPLIVVGISLAVTRTEGYGGKESCWLSTTNGLLWAFIGPALVIITVNFVILVIILVKIAKTKHASEQTTKHRIWATVWNVFIIVPILGITWVFGVFAVNEDFVAFQYIFAIANSFQGFFIFLFHGVCHRKNSNSKKVVRTSFRQMWDSPSPSPPPTPLSPPPPSSSPESSATLDPRKHAYRASRSMKTRLENHWQRLSKRHAVNWASVAAAAVVSSTDRLELQGRNGGAVGGNETAGEETFSRSLAPASNQSASGGRQSPTSTDQTDILF